MILSVGRILGRRTKFGRNFDLKRIEENRFYVGRKTVVQLDDVCQIIRQEGNWRLKKRIAL